ncbi:MAG: flagellar basal body rod protein FlgB [Bdellovibrionales bacterium]|nr:flagellar basal body rod protein FlgB [Bdellovibrionales bacterium]
MSQLFDKTTRALGKSLDMRLLRQNLINANIANAETPGYAAKKMDFEDSLSRALELEDSVVGSNGLIEGASGHSMVDNVKADVYDNPDINHSNDKNTVDLEKEMVSLAENTVMYKAAVEMIKKKLGTMKYAVTEGGR